MSLKKINKYTMNSFPELEFNEQAGGNIGFLFAPLEYISAIPMDISGKVVSAINMIGSYAFLNGYCSAESLAFEEQMAETQAGNVWQVSIKGFYPKYSESISELMREMSGLRFVSIISDSNGMDRIAGNLQEPLKFRYKLSSGARVADRSGMEFEFFGTCIKPSPIYDPA